MWRMESIRRREWRNWFWFFWFWWFINKEEIGMKKIFLVLNYSLVGFGSDE